MAAEESDETPMLRGFVRSSSAAVELSTLPSSSSSSSSSRALAGRPPPADHRYFSGPLQASDNKFFSGPLQRQAAAPPNSNDARRGGGGSGSTLHDGFHSGPMRINIEASTSSARPPPASRPVRKRIHSMTNPHLLRSGPLGKCDDPDCTICPPNINVPQSGTSYSNISFAVSRRKVKPGYLGKVKIFFLEAFNQSWIKMPGVMNPHTKIVQRWNQLFLISCLIAVFVDPLFFVILSVNQDFLCIYFNFVFAKAITVLRSATDLVYFLHMLLQFKLAYVERSSVGSGELKDKPKDIVKHYLAGWFILDLIVVLPLPQFLIWVIIPKVLGKAYAANFTKNLLRTIILVQYLPRMLRFFPLLAGNSPTGFIFETAWANFFINLMLFLLVAHVVGSLWYLFGLQRLNQCLRDACINATISGCDIRFLDCGDGGDINERMENINANTWATWKNNSNAVSCVYGNSTETNFGIYSSAVNVTTEDKFVPKYIYSLFWGFQQVSTLAGNQMPSVAIGEVLFVLGIVVLGLLLVVLLIGNMQNFLLSLSRRRVEMQLRRQDVESWMARRHLPLQVRKKVRQAERFQWAANKGVNEEELLKSLPEDIEREIRRALCLELIKKVRLFSFMEEQVLDAICLRLRQSLYIKGSVVIRRNYPIEKMHFFIKGSLQRRDANGNVQPLESGFCGEELLTWCLEMEAEKPVKGQTQVGAKRNRYKTIIGQHATSNTTVTCLDSVEAFSLSSDDLREVTRMYSKLLRNPKVQGALRYASPYWRSMAAITIQVFWRYYTKKKQKKKYLDH